MRGFFGVLGAIVSIYMMVIIVRILLTWFSGSVRIPDLLAKITDPYLNWFRRLTFLRIGYLDLTPIAAIAVLSVVNQVFSTISRYGAITLGLILAMTLQIIWSAVSFFIIFILIIVVLRLIAYLTNRNTYGAFWRVIETISQPVLYRINQIFFKNKIVNYRTGIIISIVILAVGYLVLRLVYSLIFNMLVRLPF
ncbi:MAG: YggT family protein [Treponema sp.]|nr:YggT family protein [Treponema sp.]